MPTDSTIAAMPGSVSVAPNSGHHREREQDVVDDREHRDQPGPLVDADHDRRTTSTTPRPNDSRVFSIASMPSVGPTSDADSSSQRRGQRAGLEHVDELVALLLLTARIAAAHRDRGAAAADRAVDDRRALDLVVEDRRELLADDLRGQVAEHAAAVAVEVEQDDRAVRVGVVAAHRVRDRGAGEPDRAVEVVRAPERALVLRVGLRLVELVADLAIVGDLERRVCRRRAGVEVALDHGAARHVAADLPFSILLGSLAVEAAELLRLVERDRLLAIVGEQEVVGVASRRPPPGATGRSRRGCRAAIASGSVGLALLALAADLWRTASA